VCAGLDPAQGLSGEIPNVPWLLAPQGDEFTVVEEQALFSAVRARIGAEGVLDIRAIRDRIRELDGEDLLPLLWSMRRVASRYADRQGAYWPYFAEHLLGDREVDEKIHNHLPRALAEAWIRLHRATGGRLFFPLEGKVYIKWPVAHAGIARADYNDSTDPLVQFAAFLVAASDGDEPPELWAEPAEFHRLLRDWMGETPERATSPFGRRFLSQDVSLRVVLAELAQMVLRREWSQLPTGGAQPVGPVARRPSAHLEFDDLRGLVQLVVHPGRFRVRASIEIQLGGDLSGGSVEAHGWFDPRTGYQEFNPVRRALTDVVWPEAIAVLVDRLGIDATVSLPDCPFRQGNAGVVLFDGVTGANTSLWSPEGDYYLISPDDVTVAPWYGDLFLSTGLPVGMPSGFSAYPARARTPDLEEWDAHLVERSLELQRERVALTLPPASDLRARSLIPIGSTAWAGEGILHIGRSNRLLFEARGVDAGESAHLERWDPELLAYTEAAVAATHQVAESTVFGFEGEYPTGRFRLAVSTAELRFQLEDVGVDSNGYAVFAFGDQAGPWPGDREVPRLSARNEGITVFGWPGSNPTLLIDSSVGAYRRGVALDLGGEGSIDHAGLDLPDGNLTLQLSYMGAMSPRLRIVESEMVDPGSWRLSDGEFTASLVGPLSDRPLSVFVIGRTPWLAPEHLIQVPLVRDGSRVSATVDLNAVEDPAWIAAGPSSGLGPPILLAELAVARWAGHYGLGDLHPMDNSVWEQIAPGLEETSVPRSMVAMLDAAHVARYLTSHPALFSSEVLRPTDSLAEAERLGATEVDMILIVDEREGSTPHRSMSQLPRLELTPTGWEVVSDRGRSQVTLSESAEGVVAAFDDASWACLSCGAVFSEWRDLENHRGNAQRQTCGSVFSISRGMRLQCSVRYWDSALDVVTYVGDGLVEGATSTAEPPYHLRPVVDRVRQVFSQFGVHPTQVPQSLIEGRDIAIALVDELQERSDRALPYLLMVARPTRVEHAVAREILETANLLERPGVGSA